MGLTRRGILATSTVALAGCSLLPEEDEPIEASASTPATLPEGAGYSEVAAEETTIETTVRVDLTGDVELSSTQAVVATVFRRVYEADEGRRFGLVTAPAVEIFENPEVIRDPVGALGNARVVEVATGLSVESVGSPTESGSVTLLGTDATLSTAAATTADGDVSTAWARVRAGEDSVTAVATGSNGPFDAVTRET
ncbi:hypothetical protein [Halobellus ruber]|uniref:Uncharacterized protein n=1 Tax=Halobellus ruber TaxID=2761102 RepID=A0A7J9SCX1_9EURY|nr:hypothetical protein [Halobellus ruber]MBB6644764.1 hypothetical protein [Halobellus ruber]